MISWFTVSIIGWPFGMFARTIHTSIHSIKTIIKCKRSKVYLKCSLDFFISFTWHSIWLEKSEWKVKCFQSIRNWIMLFNGCEFWWFRNESESKESMLIYHATWISVAPMSFHTLWILPWISRLFSIPVRLCVRFGQWFLPFFNHITRLTNTCRINCC